MTFWPTRTHVRRVDSPEWTGIIVEQSHQPVVRVLVLTGPGRGSETWWAKDDIEEASR